MLAKKKFIFGRLIEIFVSIKKSVSLSEPKITSKILIYSPKIVCQLLYDPILKNPTQDRESLSSPVQHMPNICEEQASY